MRRISGVSGCRESELEEARVPARAGGIGRGLVGFLREVEFPRGVGGGVPLAAM